MNKNNFTLFFVLLIINNILHYISEKVVIVLFIVVFYFLIKILGDIIESDYASRADSINNEINSYFSTLFDIYKYYRLFFRRLLNLTVDFTTYVKLARKLYFMKLFNTLSFKSFY